MKHWEKKCCKKWKHSILSYKSENAFNYYFSLNDSSNRRELRSEIRPRLSKEIPTPEHIKSNQRFIGKLYILPSNRVVMINSLNRNKFVTLNKHWAKRYCRRKAEAKFTNLLQMWFETFYGLENSVVWRLFFGRSAERISPNKLFISSDGDVAHFLLHNDICLWSIILYVI